MTSQEAVHTWRLHWLALPPLLGALLLAAAGAIGDSVTVDEPSHLVAGYASLLHGDYRLSPDHPPLGRMVLAFPLLAVPVNWAGPGTEAWRRGDFLALGRSFFEEWNDGQRIVGPSRAVAVAGLLVLLVAIGAVGAELFGPRGGVLAMSIAAFDPALIAHGHLATLDAPFSLGAMVTLLCAHRWLARPSYPRLAVLAAVFTATTLIKFSWFALIPALIAMGLAAQQRRTPETPTGLLLGGGVTLAVAAFIGIWSAYGFRFAAAGGDGAASATMHVIGDAGRPLPTTPEGAWESILHDPVTAVDRPGVAVPLLRAARSWRLLPEAYLYGLAYVGKKAEFRSAYLRGEYSTNGFWDYFLWVFAIKTPLPALFLIGAGMTLGLLRLVSGERPAPLAVGLTVFSIVYLAMLTSSGLNLGYRHLLPVTVILFTATGGLVGAQFSDRYGRLPGVVVASSMVWLWLGTWRASPHLLGFFNEAVGGAANGHLYLADSNVDWGQDLLRLETQLGSEPGGAPVWLAQAGDPPTPRGLRVRWLFGKGGDLPAPEPLEGGLYVISSTELLGVYRPLARVSSWRDPRLIDSYEAMDSRLDARPAGTKAFDLTAYEVLRRLRLIARLRQRDPDARIGTSLFLFRLTDEEIAAATRP